MATINVADYLEISQLVINRTYTKDSMASISQQSLTIKNVSDVVDVSVKITGANGVIFTPSTFDLPKLTSKTVIVSFDLAQVNQLPEGTTSINCIVDCTPINQSPPPEPPHSDHSDTSVPPHTDHNDVHSDTTSYTQINVIVNPAGGGSYTFAGGAYGVLGRAVTISATAADGYYFKNYTENGLEVSSSPNYSFSATADRTISCNFLQNPIPPTTKYTITVNVNGRGSVTGTPGTSGQWDSGTNFALSAVPGTNATFTRWEENGTSIGTAQTYAFALTSNRTLTAVFTENPTYPAAGTLLSESCAGTTLVQKFADGTGGSYDVTTANSTKCGYVQNPPAGTLLNSTCSGTTLVETFADGNGGTYVKNTVNSTQCGYVPPVIVYDSITFGVYAGNGTINGRSSPFTETVERGTGINVSCVAAFGYEFDYATVHDITGIQTAKIIQSSFMVYANGVNEDVRVFFKVTGTTHTDTHYDVPTHSDTHYDAPHSDDHYDQPLHADGDPLQHQDIHFDDHYDVHSDAPTPVLPPPYGTELSRTCSGTTLVVTYADGNGGSYTTSTANSTECGYVAQTYPSAGSVLNSYCDGYNLVTIYADGSGGSYQQIEYNSPLCGYHADHQDSGTGGGGGGGYFDEDPNKFY